MSLFIILILGITAFYLLSKLAKTSKFQILGELITHVKTNEKLVALTYDDGPNPATTKNLLQLLERFSVKATFFVIGKNVEQHPDVVKLIVAGGHELGNHSYSHPKMIWRKPGFIKAEINHSEQLLRQLGVNQEIHFRAPYGIKLFILPYILFLMKKKSISWNVDPKDYQESNPEAIASHILKQVSPGSIVLLHDCEGDRSATIAATEIVIQQLHSQGYQFKTVSELLQQAKN